MTLDEFLNQSTLPRNESRMLLQKVCGLTHSQIITQGNRVLSDAEEKALNDLHHRRQAGEPMAYLLGKKAFYGRDFCVSPNVLIPRPETELLLETVLFRLPEKEQAQVWDMGTGSGILAISLKKERPHWSIWGSDVSVAALKIAQKNAQTHQAQIQWLLGDWFAIDPDFRQPEKHSFDAIISNPPYIEFSDNHLQQGDLRFEPDIALTDFADGLTAYRKIISQSHVYLKPHGQLWLEHGFNQSEAVRDLLKQHGFKSVQSFRDLAGWERVSGGLI